MTICCLPSVYFDNFSYPQKSLVLTWATTGPLKKFAFPDFSVVQAMWHWNRKYKSTTVFTMQKSLSRLPFLPGPQTSAWRSIYHLQMKAHTASKKAHNNLCSLVFTPSCHPSSWGGSWPWWLTANRVSQRWWDTTSKIRLQKTPTSCLGLCLRETLGELTALLKTALSEAHVARNWCLLQPTASE